MLDQKDLAIITLMLETIDKIMSYTADLSNCDDFENDVESFDATIMNFIVLGEIGKEARRISVCYGCTFCQCG
jgi:uncharacterized protein with HEPN domain